MIRRVPWSEDVERGLSRALPDPVIRSIVAGEVRAGVSRLWECEEGPHRAYVVTRVDTHPTELVIVAFEGSGMHVFAPHFIGAARAYGVPVRAHVTNPVVERLIRRFGFQREEVILRARHAA